MVLTYGRMGSVAYTTLARSDSPNGMDRRMYAEVNAAFQRLKGTYRTWQKSRS
jgi:enoyl-CoA hydratase/carnithine racemase